MDGIAYLSPEWISALAWTLLHFLWQGALVGAAYGAGRMLLEHAAPRHRYALGLAALALLALLPALTLWRLAPGVGASATHVVSALGARADASPWLSWLVLLWAIGAAFSASRVVRQYLGLRTMVRSRAEAIDEWLPLLRDVAQRVGVTRPVRLLRSALVQTPCVLGWLAPVIVLPAGILSGLTRAEVELLLAHELCHLRRGDYLVNLVQLALEAVLFYHPVVHWISAEVRNEREACCDALVLELGADPLLYARTLARLEEMRAEPPQPALAASGGELLARIRRIVRGDALSAVGPAGAGPALMPLLLTALLAVAPFAGATRASHVPEVRPMTPVVPVLTFISAPAPAPLAVRVEAPAAVASAAPAPIATPAPAPRARLRAAPRVVREPIAPPQELALAIAPGVRPELDDMDIADLRFDEVVTLARVEVVRRMRPEPPVENCPFALGSHMCKRDFGRTTIGANGVTASRDVDAKDLMFGPSMRAVPELSPAFRAASSFDHRMPAPMPTPRHSPQ